MKKTFLAVALLITTGIAFAQTTAPYWTKSDCDGVSHDMWNYLNADKVVLLDFFATWCGPCAASLSGMSQMNNDYQSSNPGQVIFLGIDEDNSENCTQIESWSTVNGGNYPDIQGGYSIYSPYSQGYIPHFVVAAGPSHKVFYSDYGYDNAAIRNAIDQALASVMAIEDITSGSKSTALINAFPSPAGNYATVKYTVASASDVTIDLYNMLGQKVQSVTSEFQIAGEKNITINTSVLPNGMYLVKMHTNDFNGILKIFVAH